MKKILISLVAIALLGAIAVGATWAVFSDQEVLGSNTVATGTLYLTLNKSAGKPFSVTGAYPGWKSNWEYMDIFNTGSLPFEAYMTLEKTGGDTGLYNQLWIKLETSGGDSICDNNNWGENLIYEGYVKDFPASKLVSTEAYWHLADEADGSGSPKDNIRPGYSERVCQQIGVHVDADNSVMGKTVTFSETVDALQDND